MTLFDTQTINRLYDHIDSFLSEKYISTSSTYTYSSVLSLFTQFLIAECSTLSWQILVQFKSWLILKGHKSSTTSLYLIICRQFMDYLEFREDFDLGPRPYFVCSPSRSHIRFLSLSSADALFNSVLSSDPRSALIVALMLRCGLTPRDFPLLKTYDINETPSSISLFIRSSSRLFKDFLIPIDNSFRTLVDNQLCFCQSHSTTVLFPSTSNRSFLSPISARSISRIVRSHLIACHLSAYSCYSLRHTYNLYNLRLMDPIQAFILSRFVNYRSFDIYVSIYRNYLSRKIFEL